MNSAVHLGFALSLLLGGTAVAQEATPLSAPDSTPDALGLMQGFPPAPDKTIRFTDPDYFAFPKLRPIFPSASYIVFLVLWEFPTRITLKDGCC